MPRQDETAPVLTTINQVTVLHPDPSVINGEILTADPDLTVQVNGRLLVGSGHYHQFALLFAKIFPGAILDPNHIPDPTANDLTFPTRPNPDGTWKFDHIGPVAVSDAGADNQLVIWAYSNPTQPNEPLKRLVKFRATRVHRPPNSGVASHKQDRGSEAGSHGEDRGRHLVKITHPDPTGVADYPWDVNNAGATNFGEIHAEGQFDTKQPNAPVYLIVVSGASFVPGSLPSQPIPGSQLTRAGAGGRWSADGVASAACATAAPFPPNQLLVWASNGDGTWETAISPFKGIKRS